jgi:hypothetical protein
MTRDELIAGLEKATGPSVLLNMDLGSFAATYFSDRSLAIIRSGVCVGAPPYTSSRDAMLPGAGKLYWQIGQKRNRSWCAICSTEPFGDNNIFNDTMQIGMALTEPVARRIAELKALVKP